MQEKKILITGASRGIGLAIADRLAGEYSLILHASREENLPDLGAGHFKMAADLSDSEAIKNFCSRLKSEHGDSLYAVINNAGISLDKSLIFQSEKDIDKMLNVNLKAPIMICKTAMKIFNLKQEGMIINISSVLAETGGAFQSVYAATKAGMNALAKSLAKETAALNDEHDVRVLSIAPGYIETDMTDALPEDIKQKIRGMIPLKRVGKPADVAELVAFLLSSKSGFINGTTLHINGGMV